MKLKDKVAVVTGAARGIGRETARMFLENGARVAVCDFDEAGIKAAVEELGSIGETAGIKVDVTDHGEVTAMVNAVLERFGRIDILVNNAGITADAQLVKMTDEQFDRVIDVNIKGVFQCTREVAPHMVAQGGGRIISISSVVGLYGNFGQTNYVASKSAVIGMTKTWARELGRKGITVNAVAPGFILTEMTKKMPENILDMMKDKSPLKRLGQPRDVAAACLYLASDDAAFVHGAVLSVDGGVTI